jgi:PAS domain S-box-containing protein
VWEYRDMLSAKGGIATRIVTAFSAFVTALHHQGTKTKAGSPEDPYHKIGGAIADHIYTVHVAGGHPVRAVPNADSVRVTGYTPEELRARPALWIDMICDKDREAVRERLLRSLPGNDLESLEYRIVHKDGSTRWVRNTFVRRVDGQGKLLSYSGLLQDITDHKLAEEETRSLQQRIEFILGATNTGLDIIDSEFNIQYIDPEWKKRYGDPTGKKCYEYYMDRREACPDCGVSKALETKTVAVTEEILVKENDRPAQVTTIPFQNDEGEWLVAEVSVDVTERKQAELTRVESLERQHRLNQLQQALLAPGELAKKLKKITDGVVDIFGADFCRIWCIGPGDLCECGCMHAAATEGPHVCQQRDKCLQLLASSGRYTHTDGVAHRRVPFDACKIGRVASGQEHKFLTNDVVHDPRVHNHDWARELGLASFAGYQLRPPGGETLGVLALFSKHALSSEDDAQLDALSTTAARVVHAAHAEEALRASEERYRMLFEGAAEGILVADIESKQFKYANPAICRMLGYTVEELTRLGVADIHPKKMIDSVASDFEAQARHEKILASEIPCLRKDGSVLYANIATTPVVIDGRTCNVGFFTDVTDRKLTEESLICSYRSLERAHRDLKEMQSRLVQNEKLASIGQLAAGVAHEMNTPVGFVASNFETLESYVRKIRDLLAKYDELTGQMETLGDPRLRSMVDGIGQFRDDMRIDFILQDIQGLFDESREGLERVTSIVQNLRDFSRIDQPGSRDEYDLNKGIEATLVVARNEIKYDADVQTEFSEIPLIFCHSGQINQVLLNILVNAAQAIRSQGREDRGTITIRTYASDGEVVCEIADDGPGIAPEHLSKVFDPFFTTKPPGKGTGLGLSVSYDIIVPKHNGTLLVESTVGQGAKFTIKLPLSTVENNEQEIMSDGKENGVVCGR